MNTIRTKITAIAIACSLIMGLSLGTLSFLYSGDMANDDSKALMLETAQKKQTELDSILSKIEQSVDTLSEICVSKLTDFETFKSDEAYVEKYTESISDILLQFAENTSGALTAYIRYNPDFTPPTSGVFYTRNSTDDGFESIEPTDFSTFEKDDLEHVGWYYIPVENKKPTWMNPYLNQNINVSMISYVIPVYIDDVSVGIIGMDISLSTIEKMIAETTIYDNGYSCLIDSNHNFVVHKDYSLGDGLEAAAPAVEKIVSDAEKENDIVSYEYQGDKKLMTYLSLQNGMKYILTARESDVNAKAQGLLKIMSIFLVCGLVISCVAGWFISGRISRPMRRLTEIIGKIASLNLQKDARVAHMSKRKDEIGKMAQEVGKMSQELETIASRIRHSCDVVNQGVVSLEDVMNSTNNLCQDNSATMEQMAAGMEESASTVDTIQRSVQNVNENVQKINSISEQGKGISEEVKVRAGELKNHTESADSRTREIFGEIRQKSDLALHQAEAVSRIHELVETISQISSQTNLLALNASIEAARAGDVGKGFTVVAEEIRVLAEQTSAATTDISELISNIRSRINQTVTSIGASTEAFADNTKNSKVVLTAFTQLKECIENIGRINQTLSSSMNVFIESTDYINQSYSEIDDNMQICITSTNGAKDLSKEQVERVGSLEDQSRTLQQLAGQLKESTSSFTI